MLISSIYDGRVMLVKLLCRKGADLTIKDNVSTAHPNIHPRRIVVV